MAELKKCPFCGGEAFVDYHKFWDEKTKDFTVKTYGAFCDKCGSNSWQHYRIEEEAIEAWNNRAYEAELRASVIDEFAEAIIVKATEASEKAIFDGKLLGEALSLDCVSDMVVEIAEQMRKGE